MLCCSIGKLDLAAENREAANLSELAAKELVARRDEAMDESGRTIEEFVLLNKRHQVDSFVDYVDEVKNGKHLGTTEFFILSKVLKKAILIYKRFGNFYRSFADYGTSLIHSVLCCSQWLRLMSQDYFLGCDHTEQVFLFWSPNSVGARYQLLVPK